MGDMVITQGNISQGPVFMEGLVGLLPQGIQYSGYCEQRGGDGVITPEGIVLKVLCT